MTGSLMIDGLMAFFALATLGAAGAPLLLLPKWMAGVQTRRIAFHRSAIEALTAELARPQHDAAHADRLALRRQQNIAALKALVPTEAIQPLPADTRLGLAA
ncbi:hypothetical protein [Polymorphobacter sp.]|uniref:hypothetical protein n=1 Tax=Polymorphobacter sp. TaxID=1909290 RepID=UPI003F72591F